MELRILQPVRDTGANCARCELQPRHRAKQVCFAAAPLPHKWNGIMVVGEGPGRTEVARGKPFCGKSGELLRALMASEGINLDECYLTLATLCMPDSTQGSLEEQAPNAVHACLPRLEHEIALVKPRVILAFGNAALQALTGKEEKYEKREAFACNYCGEDRKVDGVACSLGSCQHVWEGTDSALKPTDCPNCGATWKRLKVRRVKCPKCNSLKMRTVQKTRFVFDYKIGEIAGAVIDAAKHGWDEFDVKYVIPTYHPSFLLHSVEAKGSGEKKTMTGQFAAKTVQRHLRKALHLVSNDIEWKFDYEVTSPDDDMDAAHHVLDYIYGDSKVKAFTLDVETEAWGTHYVCKGVNAEGEECGKKSGIEHAISHETAPELARAYCKACAQWTRQVPTKGELDARELENVTTVKCLGFGSEARGYALVVDTRLLGPHMPNLREAVRKVLTDPAIAKCAHHGTYDMPVIERLWGIRVVNYTDDTLMMHHVLAPDEKHDLAHLAFRYTYARIWKPPKMLKGHAAHQTFAELAEYNARDVMLTDAVRKQMASEMVRKGTAARVYALDMELQQQALDMQRNGLPIDMVVAREVGAKALRLREIALKEMRVTARNPEFNPNSPEQLIHVLYNVLAYPVLAYTDGGKSGNKRPSTSKDVVLRLPDTAFKRSLLEYVDANKTLKAYFDVSGGQAEPSRGLNLWADKRAHAVWKPFGTRTGRFTSNPNMQNQPKWLRAMFVAPPGRKIVGADMDQLELRIVAGLCGDANLIHRCLTADETRKLEPDHDPHSYVASLAFGVTFTDLLLKDPAHNPDPNYKCKCQTCERKALRDLCKRVIYGLNYGAGDATVFEAIYNGGYNGPPISIEMIGRVRTAIFRAFPAILTWRETKVKLANRDRAVFSALLGRWRTFPLGDIPATEIYNFDVQSTGADLMNIQGTAFYKNVMRKVDPSALYIAQIHDANYYEVDDKRADDFAHELGVAMSWKGSLYKGGPEMPYTATGNVASNLKDA